MIAVWMCPAWGIDMTSGTDISVLYIEFSNALTEVLAENAVGPARRGRLAKARAAVKKHPEYSEHAYFFRCLRRAFSLTFQAGGMVVFISWRGAAERRAGSNPSWSRLLADVAAFAMREALIAGEPIPASWR